METARGPHDMSANPTEPDLSVKTPPGLMKIPDPHIKMRFAAGDYRTDYARA